MAILMYREGQDSEQFIALGQQMMDATAEHHINEEAKLVRELGVSEECAADISYLRTRSRHTPELEERLIREHKEGKTIMIWDWPYHSDGNYNPFTGEPL